LVYWVLTSKWISFDSAHHIEDYEGKCHEKHGHTYRVCAKFIMSSLDKREIGIDFAQINQKLKYITLKLDHHDVNEVLQIRNATAEIISHWIYDEMRKYFPTIYSILLQEGDGGVCEFVGYRRWS